MIAVRHGRPADGRGADGAVAARTGLAGAVRLVIASIVGGSSGALVMATAWWLLTVAAAPARGLAVKISVAVAIRSRARCCSGRTGAGNRRGECPRVKL